MASHIASPATLREEAVAGPGIVKAVAAYDDRGSTRTPLDRQAIFLTRRYGVRPALAAVVAELVFFGGAHAA